MAAPILSILFTIFQSICQVFFISLAGYTLSYNGIVDKPTSKVLNHINIALFTPALLFSKVAFFLTPAKLRQLWVIPIFFTVLTGLSGLIAHYLARACRLKRSQINFATAASMFMNSNSLPVALMQSLASTVPLLKWGPDDTLDAMFGRSLTYLVVFSTLGMILRWSYGVQLLTKADDVEEPHPPPTVYTDADENGHPKPPHITVVAPTAQLIDYEIEIDNDDGRPGSIASHPSHRHSHRHHSHHHTHIRTRTLRARLSAAAALRPSHTHLPAVPTALGDESESESESESDRTISQSDDAGAQTPEEDSEGTLAVPSSSQTSLPPTQAPQSPRPAPPKQHRPEPKSKSWFKRLLAPLSVLSPPLAASLAAIVIALVPPFQRTLNSGIFIPFRGALEAAGGCSVPLTLIVLGGWFWDGGKGPGPQGVVPNGVDDQNGHGHDIGIDTETKREGKGKAVGKASSGQEHARGCVDEVEHTPSHSQSHTDGEDHKHQPQPHARTLQLVSSPPRTPSNASLSSALNAFGDVVMARIHPGSARRKARGRPSLGSMRQDEVDVEAAEGLTTHAETEDERTQSHVTPSKSKFNSPCRDLVAKSKNENPPGESLTIAITLLARMVVVPIVVTPLMIFVRRTGWGGDVFNDPIFLVSSMLLIASPPALTLAQISQRAQGQQGPAGDPNAFSPFERLLSRTVFWAYCVMTPPLTILSVMVGLIMVGAA